MTQRVKSIISNVQREDVGPVEMAEALQALMDEDQRVKAQEDLAGMIGKDKTWVSGMLRILSVPVDLQRKVGSTQLSISCDTMIRIARLEDQKHQQQLIEQVLSGATQREIRDQIDRLKGKPAKTPGGGVAKPKRVYHTRYKAVVIVQSETIKLTADQAIEALQDALRQAVKSPASET